MGALGVAVDAEPAVLARELPRHLRRARLAALREAAHLHVPGSRAGELFAEASDGLGDAEHAGPSSAAAVSAPARTERALTRLDGLPARELTETGAALLEELRAEWQRLV